MDRETTIRKIKACLRLAKSSNANEAATALRQAQALMDQIGVDEHNPELLGVNEASEPMNARRPASWEAILIRVIADAFGCERFYDNEWIAHRRKYKYSVKFVGLYHRAEVAAYTFAVLRRQCRRARVEYLKTLRRIVRKNKIQKADVFCLAWVNEVADKISAFELVDEERRIVKGYLGVKYDLHSVIHRITKARPQDYDAAWKGRMAADGVVLNNGVETGADAARIGATLALGSH